MTQITEVFTERLKLISLQEFEDDIYVATFRRIKNVPLDGLTFIDERNTVTCGELVAGFTPATFLLLFHLWRAKERFLSKEDIRQDVVMDAEARDEAVRVRIAQARRELQAAEFPYRIVTVQSKGYRLVQT